MDMSTKKNLPNIPIYIGDWERDCNVLTLESEAAWMRIVFKLWTKGKQNSIKIPTKSLQNLWRCSPEKMREILDDLIYNEIAEIAEDERFIEFTCRRFVKENKISKIRSEASKGSNKRTKDEQKPNKTKTKGQQNTENDYENESDYDNENKNEDSGIEKNIKNINVDLSENEGGFKKSILNDIKENKFQEVADIFNSVCPNLPKVQKITKSRKNAILKIEKEYGLEKIGEVFQNTALSSFLNGENDRGWRADFDWLMNPNNFIKILEGKYQKNGKQGNQNQSGPSDDFRRKTAERLGFVQSN